MKQVIQHLGDGTTRVIEAPGPEVTPGHLLIQTHVSLISAGTERMLVEFGRAGLLSKARQQPEKVRMVLDKIRTDGLIATVDAVRSKLDQPLPLGYCNVGTVLEVGAGVDGFAPGDRVVSNGGHADIVRVPVNLCARVPDAVDDSTAVFTVLASIGLQGIRLAQPTLGETVVVTGAGLIGLLTIQLLRAQGCRVLAIDFDTKKLELARQFGAEICNPANGEDPVSAGMAFSRGRGVDAVIVTAATQSSDPITDAARMSRKRGRIVLVGVTGLELNRADFYEKELTFQVSCSYGPGRYDPEYENRGKDYPLGFVRWTEQRNFEAVLDMMAASFVKVESLISQRFAFDDASAAYERLANDRSVLGMLLDYPRERSPGDAQSRSVVLDADAIRHCDPVKEVVCAFVGAGNYGSRVLIPAFKSAGARLHTLLTSGGLSAAVEGKKAGFGVASTDFQSVLDDPQINAMVIVTRHDTHTAMALAALRAGKHVFVEKPLSINVEQLAMFEEFYSIEAPEKAPLLMVGYNRRFAPHILKMKRLLQTVSEPPVFSMLMNAGAIPADHWTQDPDVGGGRIIGEACHYVDLMRFLAGSEIVSVQARRIGDVGGQVVTEDKAAILLSFANGAMGTIQYLANGHASFPKERIEVFVAGRVLQLDNFRALRGFGWPGFGKDRAWRQDKGQCNCAAAFVEAVKTGGPAPISHEEILEVTRASIDAARLLRRQG